jgi:hypothetical protein
LICEPVGKISIEINACCKVNRVFRIHDAGHRAITAIGIEAKVRHLNALRQVIAGVRKAGIDVAQPALVDGFPLTRYDHFRTLREVGILASRRSAERREKQQN